MLDYVKDMVADAVVDPNGVRVGLLTFSSTPRVIFYLNDITNIEDLMNNIERVPYNYGNSNMADALRLVRTQMFTTRHGDRVGVKNLAIVITDGDSNINARMVPTEANATHAAGIQIIAIGLVQNTLRQMEDIASKPVSANSFLFTDRDRLAEVKGKLFPKTCKGIKSLTTKNCCLFSEITCSQLLFVFLV